MKPATHDITIYKGDTFIRKLTLKDSAGAPINITGWVFLSQIRNKSGADSILIATFTPAITNALGGEFTLTLSAGLTAGLTAGKYVWDLQRTDSAGLIRTLLSGKVTVIEDVSRV